MPEIKLPELEGVEFNDEHKTAMAAWLEEQKRGLVSKVDELLGEKKAESAKAAKANEEAAARLLAKQQADKDIDGLTSSYEDKLKVQAEQLSTLQGQIKQREIGALADAFVSENVIDDSFIRRHMRQEIMSRLDLRDGRTVVLDAEGGLTSLTFDDLALQLKQSGEYARHLKASGNSGGGAGGSSGTTGGAGDARSARVNRINQRFKR